MSEQNEQKEQKNEQQKMTGCEKFEAVLEDYASGDLPSRDAQPLTAHLEACGECREALEDARLSGRLVTVFSEVVDPGPGFTRRVMAQIDAAERWVREQKSFWRPIEAWSWRLALSASLALALLFTYGLRSNAPAAVPERSGRLGAPNRRCLHRADLRASPSSGDEVLMAIAEKHHERSNISAKGCRIGHCWCSRSVSRSAVSVRTFGLLMRWPSQWRPGLVQQLKDELQLSPDQAKQVDAVLNDDHSRFMHWMSASSERHPKYAALDTERTPNGIPSTTKYASKVATAFARF